MRLAEIDQGDSLGHRALIGFISLVSGMRLPDAARVAFYHQDFLGGSLGNWTHDTMRGDSPWSISERELMAAMVATWNECPGCIGAHRAIAIKGMPRDLADATLADYHAAPISAGLRATLGFLEKMTRTPDQLGPDDARTLLGAGVTRTALEDAIAVGTLFGIITRYANALAFAIPTEAEFDKAGTMLLKRGYRS
jgi:AhpD family alkylhydroperoxidase